MDVHPYRLVGRIKNNRLWQAIVTKYPDVRTQADAAWALGLSQQEMGGLLNATAATRCHDKGSTRLKWCARVQKVCRRLKILPDAVFDELYYGRPLPVVEAVWTPKGLMTTGASVKLVTTGDGEQAQESAVREQEYRRAIAAALPLLTRRNQRAVIAMRFGLDGHDEMTLNDIAATLNLTRERIRQIEIAALGKLRGRAIRKKWDPLDGAKDSVRGFRPGA
jgi:hypothetical protein